VLLFVAGFFIATQDFAEMMNGDESIIGEPMFMFKGRPIYNPVFYILSIFKFIYYEQFQPYYLKSFLNILWFSIAALLFAFGWSIVTDLLFKDKKNLYGTARLATKKDIVENGMLKTEGVVCGELNNAIVKANKKNDGSISLKLVHPAPLICHPGKLNTLLLAQTGAGKGVSFIIPTILYYLHSMIIYDPKSENYNFTAKYRSKFSTVLKFAPCSYETLRFNPVMAIRDGDEYAYRDASLIASIIFAPGKTGGGSSESEQYFSNSAQDLVTGTLLHIRFSDYPDKSLSGLLKFLTNTNYATLKSAGGNSEANADQGKEQCLGMIEAEHWFRVTKQMYNNRKSWYDYQHIKVGDKIMADNVHEKIVASATRALNKNAKEKSSVFSTVFSKLQLFDDPMIAYSTSGNDFEIEDFIESDLPITLYLCVPYSDIERIAPVFRLLISFMLKKFSEGETQFGAVKLKNNLLFLLDEFPTLGCFPDIEKVMGVLRGYGVFFFIVCQGLSQLIDLYGPHQAFLTHCPVKIVCAPGDTNDAELFSKSIGNESIQQGKVSRNGRSSLTKNSNLSFSDNDFGRALFDASDLTRLSGDSCILMVNGMQPYLAKKVVYYEDKRFKYKITTKDKALTIKDLYSEVANLPSYARKKAEAERERNYWATLKSVRNDEHIDDDVEILGDGDDSELFEIAKLTGAEKKDDEENGGLSTADESDYNQSSQNLNLVISANS